MQTWISEVIVIWMIILKWECTRDREGINRHRERQQNWKDQRFPSMQQLSDALCVSLLYVWSFNWKTCMNWLIYHHLYHCDLRHTLRVTDVFNPCSRSVATHKIKLQNYIIFMCINSQTWRLLFSACLSYLQGHDIAVSPSYKLFNFAANIHSVQSRDECWCLRIQKSESSRN